MNIPLDRLYHYIESTAREIYKGDVVIYHFYPHGSKNVKDLVPLNNIYSKYGVQFALFPEFYCNDQEPLNYNFYQNCLFDETEFHKLCREQNITFLPRNFRQNISPIWEHAFLLHSEKHSADLDLYIKDKFIPIYYWSHALIARDWFRYAQCIVQNKQIKKDFLIYNRAWSGTREYRLKFAEQLVNYHLQEFCVTKVNATDPELNQHYTHYNFVNPAWRPNLDLEKYFIANESLSSCSADFVLNDYESTAVEVVLETLFDDSRLHLTEKILRPIALGQPFILAGTCGSLDYLRSYGFKTYQDVWDETYDTIVNAEDRLTAIIKLMKTISQWDRDTKFKKLKLAYEIADYNKKLFFSTEFFDKITNELKQNIKNAVSWLCENDTCQDWLHRKKIIEANKELLAYTHTIKSPAELELVYQTATSYYNKNYKE